MSYIVSKIPDTPEVPVIVYDEIKDYRSNDINLLASCDADWKEVAVKLIVDVNKDLVKNVNVLIENADVEKNRLTLRSQFIWKSIEDSYRECMLTDKKLVFISMSNIAAKNDTVDVYIVYRFCDFAKSKGYSPKTRASYGTDTVTLTLTCDFN